MAYALAHWGRILEGELDAATSRVVSGSHLHVTVADEHGATTGGLLTPGARGDTTAEITVAEPGGLRFSGRIR